MAKLKVKGFKIIKVERTKEKFEVHMKPKWWFNAWINILCFWDKIRGK